MTTHQPRFIRQGDIDFIEVLSIPNKEMNRLTMKDDNIVAYGEATNHHHRLVSGQVQVLRDVNSTGMAIADYVVVNSETATLSHQEHLPLEIPQGTWRIHQEEDYNPFTQEMKKVVD